MRNKKMVGSDKKYFTFAFLMFSFFLLFSCSFASANFFDWMTGRATEGGTSLNITIGNSAPTVTRVTDISSQTATEAGLKNIVFRFNATDTDGVTNLDDATAEAQFIKAGEDTRVNTSCVLIGDIDSNSAEYECTVGLNYWDGSGSWTINGSVRDVNSAYGENTSTSFTYELLTAMVMSPTDLEWGAVGLSDTDVGSNNDPIIINNTGNDVNLNVNVTGYNLQGETTATEYIYAVNFSVGDADDCAGTLMSNATSLNITSTILQSGDNDLGNGQENIYFCLKGLPQDISSQSYSSVGYGNWNVQIIT